MNISTKPKTVLSSREFNQDTARAKRAAKNGPVFITDRGKPSHVLLSIEEYERLERPREESKKPFRSLADAIADNRTDADFDFEFPEFKDRWTLRIPDLD